jgi:hypothetical protein
MHYEFQISSILMEQDFSWRIKGSEYAGEVTGARAVSVSGVIGKLSVMMSEFFPDWTKRQTSPESGEVTNLNPPFCPTGFKCLSWDTEHWRYVFVRDVLFLLCFGSGLGGREEERGGGRYVCIHPLWK